MLMTYIYIYRLIHLCELKHVYFICIAKKLQRLYLYIVIIHSLTECKNNRGMMNSVCIYIYAEAEIIAQCEKRSQNTVVLGLFV
jgi:hypothetical protein